MKRMFFIVFFILISSLIFSQVIYLGAGYNLASSPFKKLNHVIDRYNDTRLALNLDPEMEKINFNQGMTYEFSFVQPYFQGGFGLQYNRARTHAKLVDANGIEQQRDLWLRMFSFPMELGVALGEDGLTTIPGIGINFMFWRYFTRAGEADNIDDIDYYQSTTDVCMHAKFYVKFILGGISEPGFGFMIEPYYNLGILGSNLMEMDDVLNNNVGLDYSDEIIEGFSHYGIRLMLILKMG